MAQGCLECDHMSHRVRALTLENTALRAVVGVVRRAVEDRTVDQPRGFLKLDMVELERTALLRAMEASGGNRAGAARVLGVARSTIFEMMKRHGYEDGRTRR